MANPFVQPQPQNTPQLFSQGGIWTNVVASPGPGDTGALVGWLPPLPVHVREVTVAAGGNPITAGSITVLLQRGTPGGGAPTVLATLVLDAAHQAVTVPLFAPVIPGELVGMGFAADVNLLGGDTLFAAMSGTYD